MLTINFNNVSDSLKQKLYVFRYFYDNPTRLNITLNSENWDMSDNIRNSDIFSILKKDISSSKADYNIYSDDKVKIAYAEDKLEDIYRLPFNKGNSFDIMFNIVYRAAKVLEDSRNLLILKWFIVSFFEKILPATAKAFDAINDASNTLLMGSSVENNFMSKLVTELLHNNDVRIKLSEYHMITEYIRKVSANADNIKLDKDIYKNLFKIYLKCSGNYNLFEVDMLYDNFKKEETPDKFKVSNVSNTIYKVIDEGSYFESSDDTAGYDNVVIIGSLPFDDNASNRSKFVSITNQTLSIIKENEGNNISFNINPDFKMYFLENKEDYNPIFIKSVKDSYSVIEYNNDMYLLYMSENDNSVYGITLSNWYDQPKKILKILPDEEGEFVFQID